MSIKFSSFLIFLSCLLGMQSVNAADSVNNWKLKSEPSINNLHQSKFNLSRSDGNNSWLF